MNLEKPFFSVVIPLYNKEDYIGVTLNSVLNQTFKSFEVLIVNDGSTDNSLNVVQSFPDPRLKVYTKKNGGVSEARNFGIEKAHSEYIAFLDADDSWEINYLHEMKALIEKYPMCGLYGSAYNRVTPKKTIISGNRVLEGIVDDYFKETLLHQVPCSSAVIVRKKVFDDIGGFPVGMISGEDDYTWSKIAINYKVAFTPKVLAIYNIASATFALRRGKMDSCKEFWFDFYEDGNFFRNEFIAKKAIAAGIRYAFCFPQKKSIEIEKLTRFTVLFKKSWKYLFLLNRMPKKGIVLLKIILPIYKNIISWFGILKRKTKKDYINSIPHLQLEKTF